MRGEIRDVENITEADGVVVDFDNDCTYTLDGKF